MTKLFFRSAHLRHATIQDDEGGTFVRVHVTAEPSAEALEEMEWEIGARGNDEGKLEGEMRQALLVLTPNDVTLRAANEIQLDATLITDFSWHRVKKKDQESYVYEIRFCFRTSAPAAAAQIYDYKARVGKNPALLTVNYEPPAKQQGLPLQDAPKEESAELDLGCVDCNHQIGFMDGDSTTHLSGQPCTVAARPGPTLMPSGARHVRDKKSRQLDRKTESAGDGEGLPVEEEPDPVVQ